MKNFLNEKVVPTMMKFMNTKPIQALKDGMLYSMPMMIIGSVFLLLAFFPYTPVADWFSARGITPVLLQVNDSTFGVMALIASVGIAYTYVKNEGYNGLPAGVISLCIYLLFQPSSIETKSGSSVGVILKEWTGGKGMIGALLIGIIVGCVYSFFLKKRITIKMPAGVPEGVAVSFTALIPGAVMITGAAVIYAFTKGGLNISPMEWIYNTFQIPLQGLTDSFGGVIAISFLIPFFWFFGIHGSNLITGIMDGILVANTAANQAIVDSGQALTIANGGHIVTKQFVDQFIIVTGAGVTVGMVLYMTFLAKSTQCKQIGKLGLGPGCFNINEPVTFGTPVVLNPIMAIPFILMPVLAGVIEYLALYTGLCPLYSGILVPWTTPPIISGFLIGGWRTALLQAVVIALSFFVYLPFIRIVDKMYYNQENSIQES